MGHHASKQEMDERRKIAKDIYDNSNHIEETRSDVIAKIQKALGLTRWRASHLARQIGLYEKRISLPSIPSSNPNTLICPKCKNELPKSEFPRKGKDRSGQDRYSYCKKCHGIYQKTLRIKKLFNLSMDEYDALGDVCSICGRKGKTKPISVDHNHKTGLVRGKLCSRCNRGIAWFEDNPDILKSAIQYLENPPSIEILGREVYGRKGRTTKRRGKKKKYTKPEPIYALDI